MPADAQLLDAREILDALNRRLGPVLAKARRAHEQVASPVHREQNGSWLKRSNCVGINLRTTAGLLGALKFVLTLPPHIESVHLLPIFEPGVVGSLYGMVSWEINQEFFDPTWARIAPSMRHVNDQLRAFVNICHSLGKTVGLDVIPHTDRYAEIVLCNPWLFEWIKRNDTQLLDQRSDLHFEVEEAIYSWNSGRSDALDARKFFANSEQEIRNKLFGDGMAWERNQRRDQLISYLYSRGYETLPATMAPPYRGLELDPREEAVTTDEQGRRWREFRFVAPQAMSRVFGPLTRYKLWDRLDDNKDWQIDSNKPRPQVWEYVANHYQEVVTQFGFDFMRGDMSHVQMRADGVPAHADKHYDLLQYVKHACAKPYPHFAYFAESFLTADNYMTYGSEADHLDLSEADVALGNLQNYCPNTSEFMSLLAEYVELAENHQFAPSFTLFSADKDDPRFDANYNFGSIARYFFASFYPGLPSYSSLGFRQRDLHRAPFANEYYSKLFVFQYREGPKATHGRYRWGSNRELWQQIADLDRQREALNELDWQDHEWLISPADAVAKASSQLSWRVDTHNFTVDFAADTYSIQKRRAGTSG